MVAPSHVRVKRRRAAAGEGRASGTTIFVIVRATRPRGGMQVARPRRRPIPALQVNVIAIRLVSARPRLPVVHKSGIVLQE